MKLKVSRTFRHSIMLNWRAPGIVLKISLTELKNQITHEGLGGETCTTTSRDDHVAYAGVIGFAIGRSKSPTKFLRRFKGVNSPIPSEL